MKGTDKKGQSAKSKMQTDTDTDNRHTARSKGDRQKIAKSKQTQTRITDTPSGIKGTDNIIDKELDEIMNEPIENVDPSFFDQTIRSLNHAKMLESAQTFGTPHYLLNREILEQRAKLFSETMNKYLPQGRFFYAFKCNDLPMQVKILKDIGFFADVAGIFELQLALKLGFERIVFSSPGKSEEELSLAIKNKKQVIVNIDNHDELLRMKSLAGIASLAGNKKTTQKIKVGFRLNSEPFTTNEWTKFGFELDQLKQAVEEINQTPNMEWAGLHFHCSWNKNPKKYLENIKRIGEYLSTHFSPAQLKQFRFLDIGGGFYPENQAIINKIQDRGIVLDTIGARLGDKNRVYKEANFDPYSFAVTPVEPLEDFAREISHAIEAYILPLNPGIEIFFEPGRFIATFATSILLSVLAVKKHCVILDGGINMLGDYKFTEYSFAPVVNLSRLDSELSESFSARVPIKTHRTLLYGPLCDPNDLWGYTYYGSEIRKGDVLAVLNQGAYTFCTAWRFIKPIPPYICLSGDDLVIAKEAEPFESRYARCRF